MRAIPCGKVMTYGQIAEIASDVCTSDVPAITVGRAMATCGRYAPDLPWWRVIGREDDYGMLRKRQLWQLQQELLAKEDVLPNGDGHYELAKYLYQPE